MNLKPANVNLDPYPKLTSHLPKHWSLSLTVFVFGCLCLIAGGLSREAHPEILGGAQEHICQLQGCGPGGELK